MAEQEANDCTGPIILDRLKTVPDDPCEHQPWSKRQDIWRLVKQLQFNRKLVAFRNKFGIILPDGSAIAKEMISSFEGHRH